MRAIAIKMKSYLGGVSIVNNNLQSQILNFLLISLAGLALLYVFLLGNMVFNIIERKSLEVEARTLSNQVASLELEYLSMSNKIDLAFSHSLGFKEIKTNFATRKALGSLGNIKIANNEI